MTTVNDADRTPAAAPSPNGTATLRDRVRSLRLSHGSADGRGASRAAVLLPWGVCVILLGLSAALGYYAYEIAPARAAADLQAHMNEQPSKDGNAASPSAAADLASSGDVVTVAKGYITPVHQIQVSPKVSGMLVWINDHLMEGEHFKEGEPLARIEKLPYEKDCLHAEHAASAAVRREAQANSTLTSARAALEGKRDLYRRDQQLQTRGEAIAASDLIQAQSDFEAQNATVAALEAAVAAAKADEAAAAADLEKAQWNLDNCEITAPVSGTILTKGAEKGNIVNPSAFSNNISATLCNMADLSDLEVDLKIQERDIAKIVKGMPCLAMPEAYQSDPTFLKIHPKGYTGHVSRLMPTADRSQGAISVRVRLDIPAGEEGVYLKPDMSEVQFLKQK